MRRVLEDVAVLLAGYAAHRAAQWVFMRCDRRAVMQEAEYLLRMGVSEHG